MKYKEVLAQLEALADPEAVRGRARFGISTENTYGIAIPVLRKLAKGVGADHALAQQLWASGIHEARILASLVDDPAEVTAEQAERWVNGLDSWDVCDGCCGNLFYAATFAYEKAIEWSQRDEEFSKRAGYALMASLAWKDKRAPDSRFVPFLAAIVAGAADERNFVKKAVNWALRQIGKRSPGLNRQAIAAARELQQTSSRSARWVAADALRELTGEAVQRRLQARPVRTGAVR